MDRLSRCRQHHRLILRLCLVLCLAMLLLPCELRAQQAERRKPKSTLADVLLGDTDLTNSGQTQTESDNVQPIEIDQTRLSAVGIRKLSGKYVDIYTDLSEQTAVDQLPRVFDLAVPLWAKYFKVDRSQLEGWKLTGFLMAAKPKFVQTGLLPADLAPFLNGYQRGDYFWVHEQPSDYYRRHLVLHEGVHGFMRKFLGGVGAAWFSEGVAELLATHHWEFGNLLIGYAPKNKEEVPYWGRIKIIQDEFAASRGLMIREVMRLRPEAFLDNDAYAWAWAAAAFLDGHPSYRAKFRRLREVVSLHGEQFNSNFEKRVVGQLRELDEQWQVFIVNLDYGYDVARSAVTYGTGLPITSRGRTVKLETNRGWQSSGIRLDAGKTYTITANGRFVVRTDPRPWYSEAGGVTMDYIDGRPLGVLLGSIRLNRAQPGLAALNAPFSIGVARTLTPETSGTLYLRVNDKGIGYADNDGRLTVEVKPAARN